MFRRVGIFRLGLPSSDASYTSAKVTGGVRNRIRPAAGRVRGTPASAVVAIASAFVLVALELVDAVVAGQR